MKVPLARANAIRLILRGPRPPPSATPPSSSFHDRFHLLTSSLNSRDLLDFSLPFHPIKRRRHRRRPLSEKRKEGKRKERKRKTRSFAIQFPSLPVSRLPLLSSFVEERLSSRGDFLFISKRGHVRQTSDTPPTAWRDPEIYAFHEITTPPGKIKRRSRTSRIQFRANARGPSFARN